MTFNEVLGQVPNINCETQADPLKRFVAPNNKTPILQLSIHVDHFAVDQLKLNHPNVTISDITFHIQTKFLEVSEVFEKYFNLRVEPVIKIWNKNDVGYPFAEVYPPTAISAMADNFAYFMSNNATALDAGLLLSGQAISGYGFVPTDSKYYLCSDKHKAIGVVTFGSFNDASFKHNLLHELGHILGLGHISTNADCPQLCNDPNTSPVMCAIRICSDPLSRGFSWAAQSSVKGTIATTFNNGILGPQVSPLNAFGAIWRNTGKCLAFEANDEVVPNCPNSNRHNIAISLSNLNPNFNIGCSSEPGTANDLTITVRVNAGCQRPTAFNANGTAVGGTTHTIKKFIFRIPSYINIQSSGFDNNLFEFVVGSTTEIKAKNNLTIQAGSSLTFTFQGTYVASSTSASIGAKAEYEYWGANRDFSAEARPSNFTFVSPNLSLLNQAGTLSSKPNIPDIVQNEVISINGDLIIDKDWTLDRSTLYVRGGYRIVVKSGKTLRIKGSKILACNTMWKGIKVEDGGRIIGELAGAEFSEINDAEYAINYLGNSGIELRNINFNRNYISVKTNGINAIVLAGSLIMSNCYINGGQTLAPYSGQPNYSQNKNFIGLLVQNRYVSVSNCSFNTLNNGILAISSDLQIGVSTRFFNITQTNTVDNLDFEDSGYATYFSGTNNSLIHNGQQANGVIGSIKNCTYGIVVHAASNIAIFNHVMDNLNIGIKINTESIATPYAYAPVSINYNTITNVKNEGIVVYDMLNAATIKGIENNIVKINNSQGSNATAIAIIGSWWATDNANWGIEGNTVTLDNANVGINVDNLSNFSVSGNKITLNDPSLSYIGIQATALQDGFITNNCIERNISGRASSDFNEALKTKGILMNGSSNTVLENNTIAKTGIGTEYMGNCNSSNGYRANAHIGNNTGVLIHEKTVAGNQDRTGNAWDKNDLDLDGFRPENQNQYMGRCLGGQPDLDKNRFFLKGNWQAFDLQQVVPDFTEVFINNTSFPPSNPQEEARYWFHPINATKKHQFGPASTLSGCTPVPIAGQISCVFTESDESIATGEGFDGEFAEERKWELQRQLYNKTKECPPPSDGSIAEFVEINATSNIGRFYAIGEKVALAIKGNGVNIEALNTSNASINSLFQALKMQNSVIATYTDTIPTELITQLTALQGEITTAFNVRKALMQNVTIDNTKIAEAITEVREINPQNIPEAYLRIVLSMSLDQIANAAGLQEEDRDILRPIANDCPLNGGIAVFIARALLAKTGVTTSYDDVTLCGLSLERNNEITYPKMGKINSNNTQEIVIVPNPAQEEVRVLNLNESIESSILVTDLSGKNIITSSCKSSICIINTSALQNGIYLISVQNGTSQKTSRIAILK